MGANAGDLRSNSGHWHEEEAQGQGCPIKVSFIFPLLDSFFSSGLDSWGERKPSLFPYYGNWANVQHTL